MTLFHHRMEGCYLMVDPVDSPGLLLLLVSGSDIVTPPKKVKKQSKTTKQ